MAGRRVLLERHGRPHVLKATPFEPQAPGAGQILIEVAFAGVNFAELMQRVGLYQAAPKLPFVPGFELAGTVAAVGPGGADVNVGDRVAAATRFGGYTSHATLDAGQVMPVPDGVGLDMAAGFPATYLTAWMALHEQARIRPGECILIHGGAGGVGLAAIDLAKQHGCRVIATAGGPEKKRFLEGLGIEAAIDYREAPWPDQVRAAVGAVDCVLDAVGGRNLHQSMEALAPLGRVVSYGGSEMIGPRRNLLRAAALWARMHVAVPPMVRHSRTLSGLHLLHLWDEGVDLLGPANKMLQDIQAGRLAGPRIDRVFDLDDAADAHQYLHDRRNIGKVLLRA